MLMPDSSGNSLLDIEDLSKSYPDERGTERFVLEEMSFRLGRRDALAVIGPSGCGKTTMVLMIAGLLPPTTGRILLKGSRVIKPRRETGLVLQDYGLFPWKTARQNIALGAKVRREPAESAVLAELEEELGIAGLEKMYPQQLSGGQRQRVALGRALLLKPELLLLDEPFAALDAMTRERLQKLLLSLFNQRALSYIIVTHSIEEAVILGRRVMVVNGRPGSIATILDNPTFDRPDQRTDPEFFETCVRLRRILGESQ